MTLHDRPIRFDLTLTDRDLAWLQFIARHGPQSSAMLHEATRDTHRCKDSALRRLQTLRDAGLLRLPRQQRQIAKADFNPYVYDLTREAELALNSHGCWENPVRPTGYWWHAFWVSSATATLEINTKRQGAEFIPARRILDIRGADLAIPTSKGKVIPDQLFALRTAEGYRTYALEVDRGTEPLQSTAARKSLQRSMEAYTEIVEQKLHQRHYGIKSNLIPLWVFTSAQRFAWWRGLFGNECAACPGCWVGGMFPSFGRLAVAIQRCVA